MKQIIFYFLLIFLTSVNAFSQTTEDTTFETSEVIYNKNTGVFTSVGYSDIKYKNNDLRTKTLEFDTNTKEILAKGNVNITNPTGNITTQNLIINTENENASIGKTNVSFGQNSYASSERAEMIDKNKVILHNVEYTACKEGLEGCGDTPTWKIGASKIKHDTQDGSLVYSNALIYLFDTPIFYLPYLINYAPHIKNKTGFLFPSFGTSSNLGYFKHSSKTTFVLTPFV